MTRVPTVPWGLTRATGWLPIAPLPYDTARLDPDTQLAVFTDKDGHLVELGRHGSNSASATTSMSGGSDGKNPQPQVADDSTPDYGNDD